MNIGSVILLLLAAACEFIATFWPAAAAPLVKNWMTFGFFFFILSLVINVTVTVAAK